MRVFAYIGSIILFLAGYIGLNSCDRKNTEPMKEYEPVKPVILPADTVKKAPSLDSIRSIPTNEVLPDSTHIKDTIQTDIIHPEKRYNSKILRRILYINRKPFVV